MTHVLLNVELRSEPDVVHARQRARQIAGLLGFEHQDQTRIATALSEVARNAFQYAGGGRITFSLQTGAQPLFVIETIDEGPGIADLPAIQEGRYRSRTGMGVGIVGARKLMDDFEIDSAPSQGTRVRLCKRLPPLTPLPDQLRIAEIGAELAKTSLESPYDEVHQQNQALVMALDEQRKAQAELELLNRELEETNRGVMVLYNELEEKAESLRRAHDQKSQFFSEMNHEVRTPINAILNLSELLLSSSHSLSEGERTKALGYIRKSARQLSELVSDLLDLAKTEAGKMVVRPESFTVDELFAGLRGMFRSLHTRDDVILSFEPARDLPPLYTDEGKVSQILRNFISNALKFTERGSVRVRAELEGADVVLSVQDTGVGIDPAQQHQLFQRFVQLDNPRQKRVKGTGLGLSLTRSLAELLGGRVAVESELGEGSVFRAIIPRAYRGAALASERPSAPTAEGEPAAPELLVIDDDEVSRYLLRGALRHVHCSVLEAEGGESGLEMAQQRQPAAIFLDLRMPNMSGFDVLESLKQNARTREIPVIVHTSQTLAPSERAQLEDSTVAVLSKDRLHQPQGLVELTTVLRNLGIGIAQEVSS